MSWYGILSGYSLGICIAAELFIVLALGFTGAPFFLWSAAIIGGMWGYGLPMSVIGAAAGILFIFNIPMLRSMFVSSVIVKTMKALNFLPVISETEKTALEAGATWVEGELFSGKPDFNKINSEKYEHCSEEEKAFLKGPCDELCAMVEDWEVYKTGDLPQNVWDFIKKEKFLGLIVPKKYGGKEFSAIAQSEVVGKLSARSIPLGITVMVPNSLGPAELLNHYGTQEQKDYYLPRLASGEEIPCFALTEPTAGSDAGSIQSNGVVFKGEDGKLYIKLNWDKRYITLAAVSTIIGLAVQLRDPDNLLAKGENPGITCILVPSETKGVVLGERHNPMGVPFYNCPTHGHDVVVSVDQIIGGIEGAGGGWRMLMESLAAGRSISLPAQSTAVAKHVTGVSTAYATVRRQFGMPIGKFEGVEEKLARMVGITYMSEATRVFTCGAVDGGIKPAVVSAIAKYNSTELGRICINDGMDVLGGSAISRGPRNLIANAYMANPIGITVEGANILTRTMIIFGQGAIRCHPYAYDELNAVMNNDTRAFDKAFWGHIGYVVRNSCRSLVLSLTRGWLASTPRGATAKYYRKLAWASASFSIMADVAMGSLGGKLKFKEKLTGRYADVLIWMYYGAATLRRFIAEGSKKEHEAVLQWSMEYIFAQMQEAFDGIFANFEAPGLKQVLGGPIALWSRLNRFSSAPSDALGHEIVKGMMRPGAYRDSILTDSLFEVTAESDPHHILGKAFTLVHEAEVVLKKISTAIREKKLPKGRPTRLVDEAFKAGVITSQELDVLKQAEAARTEAITVDSFKLSEFHSGSMEFQGISTKRGA